MALVNACSRKDQTAIEKVAAAISTAQTQSQITEPKAVLLLGVLETARQGNRDSALLACARLWSARPVELLKIRPKAPEGATSIDRDAESRTWTGSLV